LQKPLNIPELPVKEEHIKWHSPIIGREFEMLTFGHSGYPVIIYPTSMGSYYQNRDFKLIDAVEWFVEKGLVKIYCPDSIDNDSFYNKQIHPSHRIANHNLYDQLILNEVVSRASHETGHSRVAVAGCSFGGYHAINFAFRHPEKVSYVFSMGGAFDIRNHMDGYYDDHVYYNNPVDFLPGLHNEHLYRMGIVIGAGEHDFCLPQNYRLAEIMNRKGMRYWLDVRPNEVHDWPVWRRMLPDYFGRMNFN
jgi:esterase/lipase superfamily enzyme